MIIGIDTNHMVTPLPSGVITAPNITIITIEYRIFFFQKFLPTMPILLVAYISNGNSNDIPNANRNCRTNVTKSVIFKNVMIPAYCPYVYKNSNKYGMVTKYAKQHPVINKIIDGIDIDLPSTTSFSRNAGFKKLIISFNIIGIAIMVPINIEIWICAKNAWPGAVCISSTFSGISFNFR